MLPKNQLFRRLLTQRHEEAKMKSKKQFNSKTQGLKEKLNEAYLLNLLVFADMPHFVRDAPTSLCALCSLWLNLLFFVCFVSFVVN